MKRCGSWRVRVWTKSRTEVEVNTVHASEDDVLSGTGRTISFLRANRRKSATATGLFLGEKGVASGNSQMYAFNAHESKGDLMPRAAVNNNSRVALQIRPADKALIMRAAALAQTDMTDFILRTALREAQLVIDEHERVSLSQRDSQRVMDLLENPPAPNAKLRKAARALQKRS